MLELSIDGTSALIGAAMGAIATIIAAFVQVSSSLRQSYKVTAFKDVRQKIEAFDVACAAFKTDLMFFQVNCEVQLLDKSVNIDITGDRLQTNHAAFSQKLQELMYLVESYSVIDQRLEEYGRVFLACSKRNIATFKGLTFASLTYLPHTVKDRQGNAQFKPAMPITEEEFSQLKPLLEECMKIADDSNAYAADFITSVQNICLGDLFGNDKTYRELDASKPPIIKIEVKRRWLGLSKKAWLLISIIIFGLAVAA